MTHPGILKFGGVLLASAILAPSAPGDDQATGKGEAVKGFTSKIVWGEHWAGPELKGAKSLDGKVVLLKIWGG